MFFHLTPISKRKAEDANTLFLQVAGTEDNEIDYGELKTIFDKTMKKDFKVDKSTVVPVNERSNFSNTLLGLICGLTRPNQDIETMNRGFSKEVCRSMIAMLDEDRSGKLSFAEFKILWNMIQEWRKIFMEYDTDKSLTFSGFELRSALGSVGYDLNNRILNAIMHRFGNKQGEIDFEDFMMCSVKLKTMIDFYKEKDKNQVNSVNFTLEEWIEQTIYS